MRVLIIGGTGQLGRDLAQTFADCEPHTAARHGAMHSIDLREEESIRSVVRDVVKPELVINAAAAHHVAECEDDPAMAYAVNATGVSQLARHCHEIGARLVHVSTDYVFGDAMGDDRGGESRDSPASRGPAERNDSSPRIGAPWREDELPAPLNAYAASKLAGEHLLASACANHAIVRSSGLYGSSPCLAKGGKNFVQLMLHLAKERGEVKVVTDEILTPTYTRALSSQIRTLAEHEATGVFHATCQGECSWFEFAAAIFEETSTEVSLEPATSIDFPSPVRRPSYSALDNQRLRDLGLDIMPPWRDSLRAYLEELRDRDKR